MYMRTTDLLGSNIYLEKAKFFLKKILAYFSLLLFPVFFMEGAGNKPNQIFLIALYIGFVITQWYLLGKEVDFRLKIFFRTNSSLDRIVYRSILGFILFIVFYNIASFFNPQIVKYFYWSAWIILGLINSWPTRGKIIDDSFSNQLGEIRYLDSFEKTVLFLMFLMFIFSFPNLNEFENIDLVKLYLDPNEFISPLLWNFLYINFIPFAKNKELLVLCWYSFFYFWGIGIFFITLYCLLRYFVSRRLAILGGFVVISTWSLAKLLNTNLLETSMATFPVLWVWAQLWSKKSSTYRSGLFIGLVTFLGSIYNSAYAFLHIANIIILYYFANKSKTPWYRKQLLRYMILGITLTILCLLFYPSNWNNFSLLRLEMVANNIFKIFYKKSFYTLSIVGVFVFLFKWFNTKIKSIDQFQLEKERMDLLLICSFCMFLLLPIIGYEYVSISLIALLGFLSLLPIELIFQTISRLRLKRNIIYVVYILICLLDSHFEGRVKILFKFLKQ
jgi:hypothetical protein